MGGIQITVSIYRMLCSPARFGEAFFTKFHSATVGLLTVVKFHMTQIMLIATLAVKQFAKQLLSYHIQDCHDIASVAYIFHDHAVRAGLLRSIHQIPAIGDAERCRNFCAHMNAVFHGTDCHGVVPPPGGGYINAIKHFRTNHSAEILVT